MSEPFKFRIQVGLGISMLLLSILAIHAFPQGKAPSLPATSYDSIKREIQLFENILNTRLSQQFTHPLAVVDKPKGVYLKGYGVVFTFFVNLNRLSINTPFGLKELGKSETPEQKKRRISEVKEVLIKTLSDHVGAMNHQLSARDNVVIVAHFEDNNDLDELKKNKTVIIKVPKRELDEYKIKANYQEFRKRVEILEY